MSDDSFGKWRRGLLDEPEEDPNIYRAYPTSRSAPSKLTLRLADGRKRMLPYRFLMEVDCTTLTNGNWLISLLYPSRSVVIEGRNLDELVKRLEDDAVPWIQEFDPNQWLLPEVGGSVIFTVQINTAN